MSYKKASALQSNDLDDSRDVINPNYQESSDISEVGLRPDKLEQFIGQSALKQNLSIFIQAAKKRGEPIDHILFHGPPGLGKTTLSKIIASELGVNIKSTSGPVLTKVGELAAVLTNLEENDVLFIDEIHRLSTSIEEVLYPAMEDFFIDIVIGDGPAARTVKIDLPKFTLVGATTRIGLLSNPLKDRFGIPLKLDFYTPSELQAVIISCASRLNCTTSEEAALVLAKASRGTPRIAIRLLRRVRDFMSFYDKPADKDLVLKALEALKIDSEGLDEMDRRYLKFIMNSYRGGPVGIDTIAAALSEQRDTIEDTIEPYLIKLGFINKTSKGRVLTHKCLEYLGNSTF